MDGAHGVEVGRAGRALEYGATGFDFHNQEIQGFGNGGIRNIAAQHGLHDFQSVQAGNLSGSSDARSGAIVQNGKYSVFLRQPGVELVGCAHVFLSVGSHGLRNNNCICNNCSYNENMKHVTPVTAQDSGRTQAKPQGCTNLQLRQLTRRVSQRYDVEMSRIGIKTTQYSLLSYVVKLGPIRPADLAQAMAMEPSTLTRNLKPLIVAGWVEVAAGVDGRSRTISATPAGREKRAEAQRHWRQAQDRLNQTLGVPRVLALHALIQESLALLAETESEPESGSGVVND